MTSPVPLAARSGLTLAELATALAGVGARVIGDDRVRALDVRQDSRRVEPGDLFVARRGAAFDGTRFAADAVARGAVAVMHEHALTLPDLAIPRLLVGDVGLALARAAEAVHGAPSRSLRVIGITGTNGKTTTSVLVERALAELARKPARLGTLGFAFAGVEDEAQHTTPEADDVSRRLAEIVAAGGSHFVMEVSSHALEQRRVAALTFDVAAFSNLSQDHLDFHGSMSAYGAAKARLFTELEPRNSVINVDDRFGGELAKRAHGRIVTVSRRVPADVRALRTRLDLEGIRAELEVGGDRIELESRLVGAHNLDNLLLALGILLALGEDAQRSAAALSRAAGVPGRLERCDEAGDARLVVVDYAHTPDALERVLDALRPLTRGELICVFGCGGDRDPKKRPLMGRAVAQRADFAIVTNDNPRSEEPTAIAAAITPELAARGDRFAVELDRRAAIESAIRRSRAGDTVLIAGKGHETYQIVGHDKHPFDDRVEARRALARLRAQERS